jgi:hypothetical protein
MGRKVTDDQIRWILDLDTSGVQAELQQISSVSVDLTQKNRDMQVEMREASKQMAAAAKEMDNLTKKGLENSSAFNAAKGTYLAAKAEIADYQTKIAANTKAIEENDAAQKKIISTMSIEDMTMSQLKQRAVELQMQWENTSKSANPETYAKLEKELGNVQLRMQSLRSTSSVLQENSSAARMFGMNLGYMISELPNAALGMRTFVMSISNNFGQAALSYAALREENKKLIEQGGKAQSMWSVIGKSIFSVAGVANIAMAAFMLLEKPIGNWIEKLFQGKKAADQMSSSASVLVNTLKDSGGVYGEAVKHLQAVDNAQKAYQSGLMTSSQFTAIYNQHLGDTMGKANNAAAAIQHISDKKESYIEAMQKMAIANALFDESAKDMVKIMNISLSSNSVVLGAQSQDFIDKIKEQEKVIEDLKKVWNKGNYLGTEAQFRESMTQSYAYLNKLRQDYNDAADKERVSQTKKYQDHHNQLSKIGQTFYSEAQKRATKSGLNISGIHQKETNNQKKELQKQLDNIDVQKMQEQNRWAELYAFGKKNKLEYENALQKIEEESLMKKLSIMGLEKKEREKIHGELLKLQIKIMEEIGHVDAKIAKKIAADMKSITKSAGNDLKNIGKNMLATEQDNLKATEEKRKRLLEMTLSLADSTGEIIGGVISGNNDLVKSGLKSIVLMGLDTLKSIVEIQIAGATAVSLAQPDSVMTLGASGFARAAIMTGLIEAVFSAVKSIVSNSFTDSSSSKSSPSANSTTYSTRVVNGYSEGGYTGDGARFDVAGPVHRGEYVVAQPEMRDPMVIQYVHAIENVRQKRTSVNALPGYADGGYTGSPAGVGGYSPDILYALYGLLNDLKQNGIPAGIYLTELEKKQDILRRSRNRGTLGNSK